MGPRHLSPCSPGTAAGPRLPLQGNRGHGFTRAAEQGGKSKIGGEQLRLLEQSAMKLSAPAQVQSPKPLCPEPQNTGEQCSALSKTPLLTAGLPFASRDKPTHTDSKRCSQGTPGCPRRQGLTMFLKAFSMAPITRLS